jgi:hypothetical protein
MHTKCRWRDSNKMHPTYQLIKNVDEIKVAQDKKKFRAFKYSKMKPLFPQVTIN